MSVWKNHVWSTRGIHLIKKKKKQDCQCRSTRECMVHFRSRDKDGGHTFQQKTPCMVRANQSIVQTSRVSVL